MQVRRISVPRGAGGGERRGVPGRGASWRASEDVSVLDRIRREGVELVSWRREVPSGLEGHLVEWAARYPAEFDEVLSMSSYDLSPAVHGLSGLIRAWLTLDVAVLLGRFAELSGSGRLRVSFGAVRTDQCRKFHVDHVRYRLVTTYAGPGTEWVPGGAVRRRALGGSAACPAEANREIVRSESAVRRAVAGEVLVMKGARHEGGGGAVHRSPPIESTGRTRVVLIATTVDG